MTARRPHYVFVGAFRDVTEEGGLGGQLFACQSLMSTPITEQVRFTTIDSTAPSTTHYVPLHRASSAAARMLQFARAIREPDVVGALIFASASLSFVEKGTMALLAKQLGRRVVFFPRSGLLLDDLERSPFMRRFVPYVLRRCDVVACQGESWDARFASLGVPSSRRVVFPNWIDAGLYRPNGHAAASPSHPFTILFLGRLEDYKGIFDLIGAVDRCRDALGEVRVVVCGGGSRAGDVQSLIAARGLADRFELRGWVHDPEKSTLLHESDVLALPSHREGMPNAVLEAMASGLPVVAARVGGVPDLIDHRRTGLLIEPGDVAALGDALVTLRRDRDLRRSLAERARQDVVARHDVHAAWPRLLDLLVPSGGAHG